MLTSEAGGMRDGINIAATYSKKAPLKVAVASQPRRMFGARGSFHQLLGLGNNAIMAAADMPKTCVGRWHDAARAAGSSGPRDRGMTVSHVSLSLEG